MQVIKKYFIPLNKVPNAPIKKNEHTATKTGLTTELRINSMLFIPVYFLQQYILNPKPTALSPILIYKSQTGLALRKNAVIVSGRLSRFKIPKIVWYIFILPVA